MPQLRPVPEGDHCQNTHSYSWFIRRKRETPNGNRQKKHPSHNCTRDGKALVKIYSFVCGGPGRTKGIWAGVGEQHLHRVCCQQPHVHAASCSSAGVGFGQCRCWFCGKPVPQLLHTRIAALCDPSCTQLLGIAPTGSGQGVCRTSEPSHGWLSGPAEGQHRCYGTVTVPATPRLHCQESKEGEKDPQSYGQLLLLMLFFEIWSAQEARVLPLHQKCHGCR